MTNSIKPIALYKLRSITANMETPAVAKVNQFIIQHVATSFGKQGMIVSGGQEQPQLYTTNVIDNTNAITNMFSLTNDQREMVQDFLRGMYSAFHDDVSFCPDYIDHWSSTGIKIEAHMRGEGAKTFELLTKHDVTDSRQRMRELLGGSNGLRGLIEQMMGTMGFKPEMVTDLTFATVEEAEVNYLANNDDISADQMDELTDLIEANKFKKYVKRMAKYGVPTKYIKLKKGKVQFKEFNSTEVEPLKSSDIMANDYETILKHEVQARNPIEEIHLQEDYYLQHGIVYEHPLCFDKVLAKLMYKRAHDLISKNEMFTQMRNILEKVLGTELAAKVELLEEEGSFAMGIKANGFGGMMVKQEITQRLMNTRMLN